MDERLLLSLMLDPKIPLIWKSLIQNFSKKTKGILYHLIIYKNIKSLLIF